MNDEKHIAFILADLSDTINNLTEEECRENIVKLNWYWDHLSDDDQEKYCESFNTAKTLLHSELESRIEFGPLTTDDLFYDD